MSKVLIVEDDLTIARIYQGVVRRQGCDVEVAADGELAITVFNQLHPDLILLDLMLPKKNGVEVLKIVRADPLGQSIPVLVMTNAAIGGLVEEAGQAGATQCFIKSQVSPKQLADLVRSYLNLEPTPAAGA